MTLGDAHRYMEEATREALSQPLTRGSEARIQAAATVALAMATFIAGEAAAGHRHV